MGPVEQKVLQELISIEHAVSAIKGCTQADIKAVRIHMFKVLAEVKMNEFYLSKMEKKLIDEIGEENYSDFLDDCGDSLLDAAAEAAGKGLPKERRWQA